ncbi:hypothetical protein SSX86_016520 [Deinandra increscens subsp. villosa]|uniref:Ribonuclease H2 subunit B n=1 Tax=Deinandra increscens subsp. villosa TaxID=3103831 RepID=A0AAP0D2U2_9ASTR
MAWYEGLEETRLLVASTDPSATGGDMGRLLQLRHPKTGDSTCYLLVDGGLLELNWFKQSYGSWFMGDYICEADGGLYAATSVDPVFILLPMFDEARMKNGNDPGKFRQLDEIIYLQEYPGYRYLSTIAEKSMGIVCDCKEIGSTKFFRLNDSKVSAWMFCKVQQLKETLVKLDKNFAARSQKEILADVVMIMGEYLADNPWCKLLCNNLRLDLVEAVPTSDMKIDLPDASIPSSFNPTVQEQTPGSDKRVTRNGKQQQSKKVKVETNSHSIKDMFSRATRSRK